MECRSRSAVLPLRIGVWNQPPPGRRSWSRRTASRAGVPPSSGRRSPRSRRPLRVGRDGIGLGDVEEVDADVDRLIEDAAARRLVGHRAERHGAEADLRDQQAGAAETTSLHGSRRLHQKPPRRAKSAQDALLRKDVRGQGVARLDQRSARRRSRRRSATLLRSPQHAVAPPSMTSAASGAFHGPRRRRCAPSLRVQQLHVSAPFVVKHRRGGRGRRARRAEGLRAKSASVRSKSAETLEVREVAAGRFRPPRCGSALPSRARWPAGPEVLLAADHQHRAGDAGESRRPVAARRHRTGGTGHAGLPTLEHQAVHAVHEVRDGRARRSRRAASATALPPPRRRPPPRPPSRGGGARRPSPRRPPRARVREDEPAHALSRAFERQRRSRHRQADGNQARRSSGRRA